MAFYNLEEDEIYSVLQKMGYTKDVNILSKNFDYYFARTSHGSTLSRIVHASLASRLGRAFPAWEQYMEALSSDYIDIQGGTTGEGIHAGVMGSTILYVIRSIAGIHFNHEKISLDPQLPASWKKVKFGFAFRKNYYTFEIFSDRIIIEINNPEDQSVELDFAGRVLRINPGEKTEVEY
jgi:trehalose/maltose hydrolase-like predicted phosphorylase